ncbi:MAG: crossover junction endodeoxyribonuclease RuvC [Oscillospiraceae bacterium]|nr:crossover junction endodeoxyribonuclease RuvC [Oscillospiraceae bacterium]
MIILGIDPGVATVGFGVLSCERGTLTPVRYGVVTTPAGDRLASRLSRIFHDVTELIETFRPEVISVEELFFNTNITTGIAVAHGRGAVLLAAEEQNVPLAEYTPLQIKQAITGYGRADKKQMMEMVRRLLNLPAVPRPDDAADALAVAICHARYSASLLNRGGSSSCSTI